jgi:hypothetical protein
LIRLTTFCGTTSGRPSRTPCALSLHVAPPGATRDEEFEFEKIEKAIERLPERPGLAAGSEGERPDSNRRPPGPQPGDHAPRLQPRLVVRFWLPAGTLNRLKQTTLGQLPVRVDVDALDPPARGRRAPSRPRTPRSPPGAARSGADTPAHRADTIRDQIPLPFAVPAGPDDRRPDATAADFRQEQQRRGDRRASAPERTRGTRRIENKVRTCRRQTEPTRPDSPGHFVPESGP